MDTETIVKIGLLLVIGACVLALGLILWPTRKPKKRKVRTVVYPADKQGAETVPQRRGLPRDRNIFTMSEIIYYCSPDTPIKVGKVSLGTVGDYQRSRR